MGFDLSKGCFATIAFLGAFYLLTFSQLLVSESMKKRFNLPTTLSTKPSAAAWSTRAWKPKSQTFWSSLSMPIQQAGSGYTVRDYLLSLDIILQVFVVVLPAFFTELFPFPRRSGHVSCRLLPWFRIDCLSNTVVFNLASFLAYHSRRTRAPTG